MDLLDALGTASMEFSFVLLGQLEWACRQRGEKTISETSLNAALAIVDGLESENETEAMLGVQMASTHALAMELLARARHAEHVSTTNDYANVAVRLLRTYAAQMETFARLRRKGEQTVRVEHVHVHEGGQAVVGNVNHSAHLEGGAINERSGRPHAPRSQAAVEHAPGAAVWCEDKSRDTLPISRREGTPKMPHARRRQG